MAPSPPKRQKFGRKALGGNIAPIIFSSSNSKLDMRITVFGQEYHVHSTVLKFHSTYFREALSEWGAECALVGTQFRYDYISTDTEYDDGHWRLEPVSLIDNSSVLLNTDLTEAEEQDAFEQILKAMYNIPYTVGGIHELGDLTRLATFYGALPIVSASLYRAISDDDSVLGSAIAAHPMLALPLAKKLRHPILFREAVVHTVGDWHMWEKMGTMRPFEEDEELNNVLFRAHSRFCVLKSNVDNAILVRMLWDTMFMEAFINQVQTGRYPGVDYYLKVYGRLGRGEVEHEDEHGVDELMRDIEKLLRNNLTMHKEQETDRGRLYCANISNEEMPWDQMEANW